MAQDKKKALPGQDPALAGTPHMGELHGTPDKPSDQLIKDMKAAEAEKAMKAAGIVQDPELKGTGQPGELYGAPESPNDEWMKEMEKPDVHDEARNEVAAMLAPDFKGGWWMKSLDERFDFVKILNRTSDKDDGGLK